MIWHKFELKYANGVSDDFQIRLNWKKDGQFLSMGQNCNCKVIFKFNHSYQLLFNHTSLTEPNITFIYCRLQPGSKEMEFRS